MYVDDEEEGKTDAEQEKATCNEEEDPIPLIGASGQALAQNGRITLTTPEQKASVLKECHNDLAKTVMAEPSVVMAPQYISRVRTLLL
jgi:hypothetical protein